MSLEVQIRLTDPHSPEAEEMRARLGRLAAPPGDVWALTIQDGSKEEEWLLIARAGIQKTGIEPEWSALSIEGQDEMLRCTYARIARGVEREPGSIVRSVERLLAARSIRVARPAARSAPRRSRGTASSI